MAMAAVRLTTIFTPPASCSDIVTMSGSAFWQGGVNQIGDPACFPPDFSSARYSFYSPGICPHGWTSAGSVQGAEALVSNTAERNMLCCPSGYTTATSSQTRDSSSVADLFCRSDLPATLTNVYITPTVRPGPIPTSPSLQTVSLPSRTTVYVWEDILQVRWQSTDVGIVKLLASSTGSSSASTAVTSGQAGTAIPGIDGSAAGSSQSHSGSGLSRGAVMGIVVGVLFFAGWGIVAGWVVVSVRKRRHYRAGDSDGWIKTEFDAESVGMASPRDIPEVSWSMNTANLPVVDDDGKIAGEKSRGRWPAR